MTESKFNKSTDSKEEVKLQPALIYASWSQSAVFAGYDARFEVKTVFVGNGAKIEVTGKTEGGKKLGKVSDTINSNVFVGRLSIPDDVKIGDEAYLEVKLSKNGISGESERVPVLPAPEIKKLEWSASEARRGDILTLAGEFEEIPDDSEVLVTIYEHDQDGAHDKIAEIPAFLEGKKLNLKWEYEYHEDTDEIPTDREMERYGGQYNPPEYFFTVTYRGFQMGREQESGILNFKDYIEIVLKDAGGNPAAGEKYVLHLPDGSTKDGSLDPDGKAREEGIPPGQVRIEFPDLRQVNRAAGQEE